VRYLFRGSPSPAHECQAQGELLFTDAMAWSEFEFALSRAGRSKSNARRRQMGPGQNVRDS
jgi:hypothetical protein